VFTTGIINASTITSQPALLDAQESG